MLRFIGLNLRKRRIKPRRERRLRKNLSGAQLEQILAAIKAYHAAHPAAPALAITCRGRTDGAGAQALGVISALLWAEATGCRYLHTPFATMDHAVGHSPETWAAKWERFLNLGRGERRVPRHARIVPAIDLLRDPDACARPGSVLAATYFHWTDFQTAEALQRLRPILRDRYHSSRKTGIRIHLGPPGSLMAAVHVRRGDVTAEHRRRRFFYTPNELVANTITGIRTIARDLGRPVHINLFSEGPDDMFAPFAAAGCQLHLNGDAFEAFHNLVSADILIQAKSSFSYLAGLISTGAVLHEPYTSDDSGMPFYRPASDWILRDETGRFDTGALRQRLASVGEARMTEPPHPMQRLRSWLTRR